jgi:hypothetical protein
VAKNGQKVQKPGRERNARRVQVHHKGICALSESGVPMRYWLAVSGCALLISTSLNKMTSLLETFYNTMVVTS